MRRRAACALAVAAALAGCGGGDGDDAQRPARADRPDATATATAGAPATREDAIEGIAGFDPRAVYERDAPGVVTVLSVFGSGGGSILGRGDGDEGLGSGFVLNERGEIATNAHVVTSEEGRTLREARDVYVAFADGNRVEADLRGYDPDADVALLRIDPEGLDLQPLELGDSEEVEVGDPVAALGSPFGEEQSLTVGVVSAVDRDVASLTAFRISGAIQTDAAINPGNSGGPLVDARGRVIGINQQIRTSSGGGEGVGFALPIDLAKRSFDQLRETGRVEYAYLGVSSQTVYPQAAERFDLAVDRGAWLQEVTPGGPAARAGLRGGGEREVVFQTEPFQPGGDVVTRIGDRRIDDSGDLAEAVARMRPGDEVEIEAYRGGEKRTFEVRLGERPDKVPSALGR